jgi:SAM-dependent methyltransferase
MTADTSWVQSMPEVYDRCLGSAIFAPHAADLAIRAAALHPRRVLEIAAGTGIVTAGLVEAVPQSEITATDLNDPMVAYAAARVPGPVWQQADAMDLGFADESFDLAVCQFGVMFFPDRVGAYREVRRVLEPGGAFLFNAWDTIETCDLENAFYEAAATVYPDDPPTFAARVPHGYADPDRIRADVQAAGLRVEDVERVVLRGRAPSAAAIAEGFCLGTPNRFDLLERGDLAEATKRVTVVMTERLGAGPVEGELAAYVVTARKHA